MTDTEERNESETGSETGGDTSNKLYTLTEVSNQTGISMPTLQRYKKEYQDRIPSEGEGRTQRYPHDALEVFEELKKENMKRRGRPRKNASAEGTTRPRSAVRRRAAARSESSSSDGLLTLKEIEERTGISYPTLLRYVKTSLNRIPHVGTGRKRRYPPEAVDEFKILREESRRGRRTATKTTPVISAVGRSRRSAVGPAAVGGPSSAELDDVVLKLKELQKSHAALQRQVQKLEKELAKPLKVTVKR